MNGILGKTQHFLKQNSPTILTILGSAGVILTTLTAIKSTPKAVSVLNEARDEKGEELTKLETFKMVVPVYIPTILTGASTLACIFGANILNTKTQASLMSAYALANRTFKDYKLKAEDLFGDDCGTWIRSEIVKDELPPVIDEEKCLFYDFYSRRYFEATPSDVMKAECYLNREIVVNDCAYLNDWYDYLNLEPIEEGSIMGWTLSANMDHYDQIWVDFENEKVTMDDGLECTIISFVHDPYPEFA